MRRIGFRYLFFCTVLTWTVAVTSQPECSAGAQEPARLDLRFIPADATIGAFARPQDLAGIFDPKTVPLDSLLKNRLLEDGFIVGDLNRCDEVLLVGWNQEFWAVPSYGVLLRFPGPIDREVIDAFVEGGVEQEFRGAPLFIPQDRSKPWGRLVDERTLIVARRRELNKMLAAGNTENSVRRLLAFPPPTQSLILVMDLATMQDPLEKLVGVLAAPDDPAPVELRATFESLSLSRAIIVSLDLSSEWQLRLSMLARVDADADQLVGLQRTMADGFLNQTLSTFEIAKQQLGSRATPQQLAGMLQAKQNLEQAFAGLMRERQGRLVSTTVRGREDTSIVMRLVLPTVETTRRATDAFSREFGNGETQ